MRKTKDLVIFTLGVLFFVIFLLTPILPINKSINFIDSARYSAGIFYGTSASDLASVIIGFRGMAMNKSAYPNLAEAHKELGLDFPVEAKSTHPPTTFLFVAPIAFWPWKYASMCWAILMLLGIIYTFRVFEYSWAQAIGYGLLSIIWLPVMMSFGQLTILWLMVVAIAYRERNKNPFGSGLFIGIGALLKLFPAVMIMPFLLQKRWNAVYGFLTAYLAGIVGVFLISNKAFYEYASLEQNFQTVMLRSDNSSLLNIGYQHLGLPGLLSAVLLFGIFLFLNQSQLRIRGKIIQEQSWMFWIFLSVALLPVVWIYSLTPFLPIILNFVKSQNLIIKITGWLCIILPILGHPWGDKSVPYVAAVTLLIGFGLTYCSLLYKENMKNTNIQNSFGAR